MSVDAVQEEWGAWVAERPNCHRQRFPPLTTDNEYRAFMILKFVCEELTLERDENSNHGCWNYTISVAEYFGWVRRAQGDAPKTERQIKKLIHRREHPVIRDALRRLEDQGRAHYGSTHTKLWESDMSISLSAIRSLLNEDCPRHPALEEFSVVVSEEWKAARRPMRGDTFRRFQRGVVSAGADTLAELCPSTLSIAERYRLIRSDAVKSTFIRNWSQRDGFLTAASKKFLWEAAMNDLRDDPGAQEIVDHFTVNGEVLKPLVAAAHSDHPYIAQWLELAG